jgi:hypothetical protein
MKANRPMKPESPSNLWFENLRFKKWHRYIKKRRQAVEILEEFQRLGIRNAHVAEMLEKI